MHVGGFSLPPINVLHPPLSLEKVNYVQKVDDKVATSCFCSPIKAFCILNKVLLASGDSTQILRWQSNII